MTKIISVVSSMPMAGKTAFCMNLGVQLAAQKFRTCLFSNTTELSRLDNAYGLHPKKDLKALITAGAELKDIILGDYYGIDILPGCYGDEKLMETRDGVKKLADGTLDIDHYDFFIIDNTSGADAQVAAGCMAATETLLLINPAIEVITDAVNFMGRLQTLGYRRPLGVVVNQCSNFQFGRLALSKLKESVKPFSLGGIIPYGIILQDPQLKDALSAHKPLCAHNEEAVFCRGVAELAEKLIGLAPKKGRNTTMPAFWKDYLGYLLNACESAVSSSPRSEAAPGLQNLWVRRASGEDDESGLVESPSPSAAGLNDSLGLLAKNLSDITRELRQIRLLLERRNRSSAAAPNRREETKITLDFDSFVSSQKDP